jgi:chromosome segregation ATPase
MASHVELNPDDNVLGLSLGMKAMRLALTQKTHKVGTVRIPTGGDTDVIIGDGAQDGANRIDRDGNQLPLVDTSGIDKAAQDAQQSADDAAAKADEAIKQGEQIRQDAQAGIDDARKQAQDAAAKADKVRTDLETAASQLESNIAAVDKKADQVRSDLTRQVQDAKSEMDSTVKAAQSSADKAQSAADAAQKAADKANASTADLDKSIKAVDAKAIAAKQAAAEAQSKAENVASDLDSANAVIEQHTTELGTLTTKVSNAVTKSDSALSVSTEAKQTATEASTTATSAYADAQTALTQSTTATQTATAAKTTAESASKTANDSLKQSSAAVQTANQISTTLRTEYQTKADADKIYATQSSLKQTSDSITASVSKTYATKDALSALQNVADNAIESWQGTGVPTLTNKPASDWTTDAKRKKHSGDLYYDKATGKAYRFGSDDGKAYTWELNQDTDVTKALADASKAQTSANNAQASATAANTAAGKAQSTANTAVSNAATAKNAADAAQSSANKAQDDVDKLKIDIPETYATKSSLTQTAESITANVESVKTTANSAVTAASKAQQTADGISANLSKNYQTKSQADTIYATKASLKATSDSISAEVTKAQGTADGAVTAASKAQQTADAVTLNLSKNYQTKAQNDALYATQTSLKATSDSLSANITANAKTAQSAVDKATSLEANLNGFKTTVSETYTTKTDFNNLTISGRNLLLKTSVPTIVTGNGAANQCVAYYSLAVGSLKNLPVGMYHMQFKIKSDTAGGTAYAQWGAEPWGLGSIIKVNIGTTEQTYSVDYYITDNNYPNAKQMSVRLDNAKGNVTIREMKLEKGTKPTDWSPAPEDLQPAGDYATNSSVTQTANSIKAQVTEVSKTANGAMSKATTVEQTANGLSSKITEQGKTLNATVKTANEAKSTADSNKQTISQVKTTADGAVNRVSSLEQNLDGFKSTVAKTYQTKDGMSAYATTSALKQTSGSITAEVSKVSQTATGALNKATSVEQAASGLSTKITEQGKTLNATVKTANEAKNTADSNKATISQVSTTASNALSKASTVEQNLNGFKTTVSETYTTKTDFNSLQIGGTNLCPKSNPYNISLSNASKDSSGVITGTVPTNANATWGASVTPGHATHLKTPYGRQCVISFDVWSEIAATVVVDINNMPESVAAWNGNDNDGWRGGVQPTTTAATTNGAVACSIPAKQWIRLWVTYSNTSAKNTGKVDIFDQSHIGLRPASAAYQVKFKDFKFELGSRPTEYSPCPSDLQSAGDYATNSSLTQTASQIRSEVAEKYQSKSGMSSYATTSALTQKANEITGKVQEVAKTAQGNTTTISQVSQKADKINTTLSQKISGKADTSRVSSLEQNLDGFKTSVAKTYQTKGDYPTKAEVQSRIDQSASSIKSTVGQTYTTLAATEALRKSATRMFTLTGAAGKAKWVKLGHLTSNGDDSSVLIHVYSGDGYNGQASQNAEFEIFVKDGWQQSASATSAFGVSVSRIRNADDVKVKVMAFSSTTCDIWAYLPWAYWNGHYTLQGDYKSWQDGPNCGGTRIQDAEPTSGTAQDLAYDTLSTRSYVDQTAKSVALGVVQNYKGADGSGLATKSDITASTKSITSTVASTYATKSGVTQEISSKITQNNNSLDVKFSTKVETQNAQNKANTADSHATNAQSRVGSLEDCINFTASGVRVGKQSNGKFTGVSALVNTNGTFDLLDASGNLLTRINQHRFQVTGDDGTGSGYLSLSQDGINITVQPTADTSNTYHIQVGKSGVGITAPDRSSIECSASGGLNIETVKYGKISIGAGGLQFTNDQGWGLRLSAAGWSLKWAGNHTLATGPAAGKLYIDGREIVTR